MRYLVVLLWFAVVAVLLGTALLLARRAQPAGRAGPAADRRSRGTSPGSWAAVALRSGSVIVIGTLIVIGVMALLGLLVVHHGLAIDKPINRWMTGHSVHSWAGVMNRLTKIGNTWTCWGAAVTAAVILAVASRRLRWVAPLIFAAAIFFDHYATSSLRHIFHRLGPPASPLGTYPSGGCDRVILFYGLIAYLLWREFSGSPRARVWAAAVVAILGFNEAYSRVYLGLHWFTDALAGLLYGGLLLVVFITATRIALGAGATASHARHGRADLPRVETAAGSA